MLPAGLAVALVSSQPIQATRPNILLFLVDDLGWSDCSVPMTGKQNERNKLYYTPNLEALATESAIFSDAYSASPVCTPSRVAILTGKAPARTHVTYWTHSNGDTSSPDPVILQPKWQWQGALPKDGPFLPELLKGLGYHTIHIGKAHFGGQADFSANPLNLGFTVNVAGNASGHPSSFLGTDNFASPATRGSDRTAYNDVIDLDKYHGQNIYLEEALAIEAVAEIKKAQQTGKPFFMNFAPYAVHTPIMANQKYLNKYAHLDPKEAAYATMIETYDAALGAIMSELKRTNSWENTLVIFTSDNGGLSASSRGGELHTHNTPLRSGKGSYYEGGIRVPLIIKYPHQKSTYAISLPVIGTDLFRTMLDYAGYKAKLNVDAGNLGSKSNANRPLVWHMPHFWGPKAPGVEPSSFMRQGKWKLIYRHRDQGFELYDLSADIGETKNLADSMLLDVRALAKTLANELRRLGAQMPTLKSNGQPVPWPDQPTID
ncbi:sulfatase [Kamptonema cortianum]|nr:sulfatase [Geitlerinema splendidum]MDK3160342.1 sulfatase [Kamptonema cortianum]